MNKIVIEYCKCGHANSKHYPFNVLGMNIIEWDQACHVFLSETDICPCSRFKLDNLSLIEKLAEERKLV